MNRARVTVIDYGIGNIYSVCKALERCGADVTLSAEPAVIERAPRLVLPGVGAFANGMACLRERGLIEPIQRFAASGRPLLGICLGMQMLASGSEEFGNHEGLGLIPGRVLGLPIRTVTGTPHKIPHIGWSALVASDHVPWEGTLLDDTGLGTAVYLVHSYGVTPDDPTHVLATCMYGGHQVVAAIRRGHLVGCQFHPEKSGWAGLRMLTRFLQQSSDE